MKILLQKIILLSFVGFFAGVVILTTLVVSAGRFVGLWETIPVVTVLVWSFGSGAGLLMNFNNFLEKDGESERRARSSLPLRLLRR